jgi:hypothetical protein
LSQAAIGIVGTAAAADRRLDARLGETLGVANRRISPAAVAVMDEIVLTVPTAIVERACSNASSAKSLRSDVDALQPTMRRANASMINAT